MRMPDLFFVGMLSLASACAACGGKTSNANDDSHDSSIDEGVVDAPEDVPPALPGWHSYDGTLTGGHADWRYVSPDLPTAFTFSGAHSVRIDLHGTSDGKVDRAVLSGFDDPEVIEYVANEVGVLTATIATELFPVGDSTGFYLEVSTLSVRGTSVTGLGNAELFDGYAGVEGTGSVTFSLADDTTAPSWSFGRPRFADRSLPWEAQWPRLSEPADFAIAGETAQSNLPAAVSTFPSLVRWLGDTPEADTTHLLGLLIGEDRWDAVDRWQIQLPALVDYAHNVLPATMLVPEIAHVPALASTRVTGAEDPSVAYAWGPVAIDPKCYDGTTPCWHFGPGKIADCAAGTLAGIALLFSADASGVAFEVRAVGVPSTSFESSLPFGVASFQYATPGAPEMDDDVSFPTLTTPASGPRDTGWIRVERDFAAPAHGAGVALSLGGRGSFGAEPPHCGEGYSGTTWMIDLYVRLVEIIP